MRCLPRSIRSAAARVHRLPAVKPGCNTGTTSDLVISGSGVAKLGLTAATTARTPAAPAALDGKILTIAATDGGTATSITFGTGGVSTLDQLNTALAANNLSASISTDGKLTFTTTNDHAPATIGAFGGTAVAAGAGLFGASVTVNAPVADANAQNTRATLVSQYNADHRPDHDHCAGCVLQRHQPAEWRPAQAGVQRNRQVDPDDPGRDLQPGRSRPGLAGRRAPTSSTTPRPTRC